MSSRKKVVMIVLVVLLVGAAIALVARPYVTGGGDDGMTTPRPVPTEPRRAPGAAPDLDPDAGTGTPAPGDG